ncbi:MAG: hypothetical protein ACRCU3_06660 [Eubacteriaceae bacterium]
MEVKSEKISYWDSRIEQGLEKDENTEYMKSYWDENEDSVFLFVMGLTV